MVRKIPKALKRDGLADGEARGIDGRHHLRSLSRRRISVLA